MAAYLFFLTDEEEENGSALGKLLSIKKTDVVAPIDVFVFRVVFVSIERV